jgi:hypothetical protein
MKLPELTEADSNLASLLTQLVATDGWKAFVVQINATIDDCKEIMVQAGKDQRETDFLRGQIFALKNLRDYPERFCSQLVEVQQQHESVSKGEA